MLAEMLPWLDVVWHEFKTTMAKLLSARRRIGGLLVLCKSQNSCSFYHVFENAQCKRTQSAEQSSKVELHGLSSLHSN